MAKDDVIYEVQGDEAYYFNFAVELLQQVNAINATLSKMEDRLKGFLLGCLGIEGPDKIDNKTVYQTANYRLKITSDTSFTVPAENNRELIAYLEKDLNNNYPLIKHFMDISLKPTKDCKTFVSKVKAGDVSLDGENAEQKELIYSAVKVSRSKPKFTINQNLFIGE